jgi:hypothetical protein
MAQTCVRLLTTVLAACCVSACGIAPAASTASTTYSSHAGTSTPAEQGPTASAASRSTPGAALTNWIHHVAAGDRRGACDDMAARSSQMAACMSAAGMATFTSLHGNFVADGIRSSTPIRVTGAHVTGPNATISSSEIRVAGTTLHTLMLKHSTGIKPGQFSLSFGLSRVGGAWYVTTMNMNVG